MKGEYIIIFLIIILVFFKIINLSLADYTLNYIYGYPVNKILQESLLYKTNLKNNKLIPILFNEKGSPILYQKEGFPIYYNQQGFPILYNSLGDPILFNQQEFPILYNSQGRPILYNEIGIPIIFDEKGVSMLYDQQNKPISFNKLVPVLYNEKGFPILYNKEGAPISYTENGFPIFYNELGDPVSFNQTNFPILYDEFGAPILYNEYGAPILYKESGTKTIYDVIYPEIIQSSIKISPETIGTIKSTLGSKIDLETDNLGISNKYLESEIVYPEINKNDINIYTNFNEIARATQKNNKKISKPLTIDITEPNIPFFTEIQIENTNLSKEGVSKEEILKINVEQELERINNEENKFKKINIEEETTRESAEYKLLGYNNDASLIGKISNNLVTMRKIDNNILGSNIYLPVRVEQEIYKKEIQNIEPEFIPKILKLKLPLEVYSYINKFFPNLILSKCVFYEGSLVFGETDNGLPTDRNYDKNYFNNIKKEVLKPAKTMYNKTYELMNFLYNNKNILNTTITTKIFIDQFLDKILKLYDELIITVDEAKKISMSLDNEPNNIYNYSNMKKDYENNYNIINNDINNLKKIKKMINESTFILNNDKINNIRNLLDNLHF